ncbi:CobW family GTP-binding protein [Nocardiopsis sp. NPDC058789]|uniref:CobW family GTP-binding protein n=1 Tax=Nocardiopsis TaxID=2013 RepID=UPI00366DB845
MTVATPLRVVVVSGLHRLARRGTVDDLVTTVPGAVTLHHDLDGISEGVVLRVTRDRWGVLDRAPVDLDHPCATCALREDLLPVLLELAARGEHGLCVVETWDAVEPRSVAEAIAAREELHLAAVVTAVDAERLLPDLSSVDALSDRSLGVVPEDRRTVAGVLSGQVEYPTVVTLHGDRHREEARALVEHLNPATLVVPPGGGLVALTEGRFRPEVAANRLNPTWAQYRDASDARVGTVVWTRRRPLHPVRLHEALERIVSTGLRGRGRIWLASRPDTLLTWESHNGTLVLESAGPWLAALPGAALDLVSDTRRASASLDWDPVVGDRRQHLAVTGVDLDADRLTDLLDSCLLTDEEAGSPLAVDPFADAL